MYKLKVVSIVHFAALIIITYIKILSAGIVVYLNNLEANIWGVFSMDMQKSGALSPFSVPTAHQNGAAKFSRAPAHQPSDITYSTPQKQGRPPNAALPKFSSRKAPRVPSQNQFNQQNMDFLNVPDEGMSG